MQDPPLSVTLLRRFGRLHVQLYQLLAGRFVGRVRGLPVLLLTTKGRRSGLERTTPVTYIKDRSRYVIAPGFVEKPFWYLNLKTHPKAKIQIGQKVLSVLAEEAEPSERNRIWEGVPRYWKGYQEKFTRPLPVMLLTPIIEGT